MSLTSRDRGARTHRDRHPGASGRRRRPERRPGRARRARRAARRCPTSNGCCPPPATAGVRVVHCLVQRRPDGLGSNHNAKLFAMSEDRRRHHSRQRGRDAAARVRSCARPMSCCPVGTASADGRHRPRRDPAQPRRDDDRRRRRIGEHRDHQSRDGRRERRLPRRRSRDAVAGIPADYATAIIDNTISLLATVTTTEDLLAAWK